MVCFSAPVVLAFLVAAPAIAAPVSQIVEEQLEVRQSVPPAPGASGGTWNTVKQGGHIGGKVLGTATDVISIVDFFRNMRKDKAKRDFGYQTPTEEATSDKTTVVDIPRKRRIRGQHQHRCEAVSPVNPDESDTTMEGRPSPPSAVQEQARVSPDLEARDPRITFDGNSLKRAGQALIKAFLGPREIDFSDTEVRKIEHALLARYNRHSSLPTPSALL